jgi:hypothetical protein
MELISESDILRVLLRAGPDGMSNAVISETLLRKNENLRGIHSVKVVVSRKTKRLLEKNQIRKEGRYYYITELGRGRLNTGSALRGNYLQHKIFKNISASFAFSAPMAQGRLIMEREDFEEILGKLDEAVGKIDGELSVIINKKNVSRET